MEAGAHLSFGELLRGHRLARGLSQEELAERAGLSREAISLLERGGRRAPHRDTIALLAQTLKLSGDERARFLRAAPKQREAATASTAASSRHLSGLRPRLTSFVGREEEIAEVRDLLLARRLVTLSGPGGIGKTSLALAVASELESRFSDGACLVELAALADGALVAHAIAAALGVRERPGQPILATLGAALGTSQRLLVLDNIEHLLLSCAQVVEALLRACPRLAILATGREPLRVRAEMIWRVPPLSVPPPGAAMRGRRHAETEGRGDAGNEGCGDGVAEIPASLRPDVAASGAAGVEGYEAVRLFVERAGAVRPGFALTSENARAVAEICRRLDGIPLAIELAAAWVAALTPEQIARHLDDRFRLLAAGNRTALPRHQTLRALFDWSHDLLSEEERVLFRRLAVFAGGWTLEAAEAVCGDEGRTRGRGGAETRGGTVFPASADPDAPSVLDLLLRLVDKSLVLVEERGAEARYRLLETWREYAREKLDASGETLVARAAHAAYFAAWAGGPGPQSIEAIMRRDVALPLGAVAAEADNLRAALGYFLDRGEAEAGLGLAARIYHLWFLRGPHEEGRAWLKRLLARPVPGPSPSRAAALFAAGWLAEFQGDLAAARAAFAEAAGLAAAQGDLPGRALARVRLGVVASLQGDPARARAELEESARLAREGDAPSALLASLVCLGTVARAQGDLAGAREALAEGRAVRPRFPALGFRLDWLAGDLALAEGHVERAARDYRAALAARRAARDPVGVAVSALGLAEVAAAGRDGTRAARLLGGSEGIALDVGGRLFADESVQQAQHARVEAAARELLGDDTFAVLRAEGRRLSADEVVRLALAEARSHLPVPEDVEGEPGPTWRSA